MRHVYNAELGRAYEGISKRTPVKFQCQHPRGFEWWSNAITSEQGYMCREGCGQKCDFNPDYFLYEGNVKPLAGPNPNHTKVITFSEEGTKMGKAP